MGWTPSGRDPGRPVRAWPIYTPRHHRRRDAPERASAHRRNLRWPALHRLLAQLAGRRPAPGMHEVRVRRAHAGDELDLLELTLDAPAGIVPGPLLVAETGGRVQAALSLSSGDYLASDSLLGDRLLALLRFHAHQLALEADVP